MNRNCGIYKITSPTGKIYIGQSEDIERRWKIHKAMWKTSKKSPKLFYSLKKYGVENHQFDTIEYCDKEDLNCSERFWQDQFNVLGEEGLNCILTQCGEKRYVASEETRRKISDGQLGEKNHMFGKKGELNPIYGRVFSNEHVQKIKEGRKGQSFLGNNPRAKLVLCLITGVFYSCAKEASEIYNIKHSTLRAMLNGNMKNKTNLIYC